MDNLPFTPDRAPLDAEVAVTAQQPLTLSEAVGRIRAVMARDACAASAATRQLIAEGQLRLTEEAWQAARYIALIRLVDDAEHRDRVRPISPPAPAPVRRGGSGGITMAERTALLASDTLTTISVIATGGIRKPLRDLTRGDLTDLLPQYESQAQAFRLRKRFARVALRELGAEQVECIRELSVARQKALGIIAQVAWRR